MLCSRLPSESDYVFPSRSKSGHVVEPKKIWQELRAAAGLDELRMHDLRRTLGSWQASAGVSTTIIGKSLGHAAGSRATSVYARLDLDDPTATWYTAVVENANGVAVTPDGKTMLATVRSLVDLGCNDESLNDLVQRLAKDFLGT